MDDLVLIEVPFMLEIIFLFLLSFVFFLKLWLLALIQNLSISLCIHYQSFLIRLFTWTNNIMWLAHLKFLRNLECLFIFFWKFVLFLQIRSNFDLFRLQLYYIEVIGFIFNYPNLHNRLNFLKFKAIISRFQTA